MRRDFRRGDQSIDELADVGGVEDGVAELSLGHCVRQHGMEIRRAEPIKNGSDIVGNTAKIKVVKNKVAPPFRACTIEIIYGEGISKFGEIIDIAESKGILRKAGNWFSYKDEKIGNGREATKRFLIDHPEVCEEIEAQIRADGDIPTDAD